MDTIRILIVEDDEDINRLLCKILERAGYQATSAFSGTEARLILSMNSFQLILMDLMLPGMSGEDLLPEVVEKYGTPVIVISAKSTLEDKVKLLRLGADDYISKPFEREEVLARVEAILRRSRGAAEVIPQEQEYRCKKLLLKVMSREVFVDGNPITLTAHEFDILYTLLLHPDRVYSKDQLYQEIWKTGYYGEDNTINVHISNIRKKIKEFDDDSYIKTVWGIGFKLDT